MPWCPLVTQLGFKAGRQLLRGLRTFFLPFFFPLPSAPFSFPPHFPSSLPPRNGPTNSAKSVGEHCNLPSGVWGGAQTAKVFRSPEKVSSGYGFGSFSRIKYDVSLDCTPPHNPNFLLASQCTSHDPCPHPRVPVVTPLVAVKILKNTFSDGRVAL